MDRFLTKGEKSKSVTIPSVTTATVTNTTTSLTTTTASSAVLTSTTFVANVTTSAYVKPVASTSKAVPNVSKNEKISVESMTHFSEASDDDDDDDGPPPAKKTKSKDTKGSKEFNDKWLTNVLYRNWLVKKTFPNESSACAYCKVCDERFINHKGSLDKHMKSGKHATNMRTVASHKPIDKIIIPNTEDDAIKRAEVKICAFVAEHNLPISLVDDLVPFMANIYPDSTIAQKVTLGRTKATNMLTKLIAPACTYEILKVIKEPGNFFSIIMDETTDNTIKKQCALSIIYHDGTKVQTSFLDIYEVGSGKAEDLCQALLDWLKSHAIPLTNFIGFASDTTNSMVGEYNSVFSHLKQHVPEITCVKCSCHMIHLVASKACLKLPRSVEDMLKNIAMALAQSLCGQDPVTI
ncbi:uncharacterized protein LOC134805883 [Cydia splendana]|uniref:uncharacterized protein LOC134805883 n=1 Tax=Cydia splendana TaxID=1100963 RepID=UPI00300C2A55